MAKKPLPCPTVLRQLLRYEPETGRLFWKPRGEHLFPSRRHCLTWMTRYCGKQALNNVSSAGYLRGNVFNRNILAHRAAWAIQYGAHPVADVDHINGDPLDNRIENLRHATRSDNMANSRSARDATSNYLGVSFDAARGKWAAELTKKYKKHHLGRFSTEEGAARAYDMRALELHGPFARLNFPRISPDIHS